MDLLHFALALLRAHGVVLPGHPAEGKLLPGDRVLAINGERITTLAELRRTVAENPDREITLAVFRDNGPERS